MSSSIVSEELAYGCSGIQTGSSRCTSTLTLRIHPYYVLMYLNTTSRMGRQPSKRTDWRLRP